MSRSGRILVLLFIPIASFTPPASADQLALQDGSLLQGELLSMQEGVATFATGFSGELAIPWEQITGINTEGAVAFERSDGTRLVGQLKTTEEQQFVLVDEGQQTAIALDAITSIGVESGMAAEPIAVEPAPEEGMEAPKLWAGRAEFGLNGQTGNKERVDIRLGIDLERKTERFRTTLYLKGQYAETNSEKSANEVMGGTRVEYDFSERTYVFGKLDLEHDEFEDLDIRATVTTGLGHFFIKREKVELKGWAGAGYEYERFTRDPESTPTPTTAEELIRQELLDALLDEDNTSTESSAVVEIGYNLRKDFKQNFRFKHGLTYYPSLDDPGSEYRLTADTSMEFPLGKDPDWTLRTGVRNEYDAMPEEGIDKLDTTYYLNLGYNW